MNHSQQQSRAYRGVRLEAVVAQARLLADGPGEFADRELLEAFVSRQDQAAFAAIVERHGPMVLRMFRRVLGNADSAEDAFQGTFLILA